MGVVFRAHDERLDRDVALKVLPAGALTDEAARKQFRKEALTISRLNHAHVATVFDFDTQDGVDFLVMEYVSGVTLAEKLMRGPLPEKELLALAEQIASTLEEAHSAGIVHCDLKPSNIMVTAKGQIKLLDFGVAQLLRPQSDPEVTRTAYTLPLPVGTLAYMSPEQLRGNPATFRTDLYSF